MEKILPKINCPDDLKGLSFDSLNQFAGEVREFLIEKVSKTGGHLSSNLGVVELTIALHRTFNAPRDKIIWDVGHQSYVHKIICGRRDRFDTLRQYGGLSGFPKPAESIYDTFETGHSSTALSAALGFAAARDLNDEKYHVVAVVGDASFTGGLSMEAFNHISHCKKKVILVLNDNQMSIGKNTGAFARYLNRIRTSPSYYSAKREAREMLDRIPLVGKNITYMVHRAKTYLKYFIAPGIVFEELGYKYIGPVDGHNIRLLCDTLSDAKNADVPVIVHVCTKKGKGYKSAEDKPSFYHAIAAKKTSSSKRETFGERFGATMVDLARENAKLVAVAPSMAESCGLSRFIKEYPGRFFDTGIAEAHSVTFAAGLAAAGFTPVVSVYSSFLQRAYDSLLHDVALANRHVVLAVDRAGVVGEDGETHQGIFDLSYLSHIPNMSILAPASCEELEKMLIYAVNEHRGPIAIRYPKGGSSAPAGAGFVFGRADVLTKGRHVTIAAVGNMVQTALEAAKILTAKGITAEVVNLRTIKPLDEKTLLESAKKTGLLITLEDNTIYGGVGSMVAMLFAGIPDIRIRACAYPDTFVPHGTMEQLREKYGLCPHSLAADIEKLLGISTEGSTSPSNLHVAK